ncbi:hypothetical protein ACX2JY_001363 [Klebsiella aerogenes]|uniref:hypothetical protein n=1 Tax=Klebsiella aerogenes TaxID=548 RepID=UPI000A3B66B9|nr:hypothetical protein [Klebsiella aerogenes]ELA2718061.1 hypothetical protein [Klebsiella aerogenes]ELA2759888.1 hypothetical protein [Klebsiella aerogenes]MBK1525643.1 hypothetical protein [Klebsiella aerogenes]OUE87596.1 hypothetical protein AZZ81_003412 [Klebsiella aerogenes]HEO1723985.1 hypothetical protein [Klebsiella aerogenes]
MNNELTAALLTIEKCRELSGCPSGVDLQDWVKQLAEESLQWQMSIPPRIVAGIKADGVDIIRNALIKFVEDEVGPNDVVPGLIRGAEICVSVADSLREGDDK